MARNSFYDGAPGDEVIIDSSIQQAQLAAINAAASETAAAASAAAALISENLADADATAVAADLVATNQDTIDTAADLVATNQDTIDTAADVVLTHADVVLTHADAAATALDKIATNADVVLTNADAASTASDKTATNADVVTTNADVVLTHADVTLTNADVLSAEDSQLEANDWANRAENLLTRTFLNGVGTDRAAGNYSALHWKAKTSADEALTNADAIATAADKIATNADAAATALDKIATNADATATALDKIATNADVVLTNADVVLTNADVALTHADELLTRADAVATAADRAAVAADLVLTNQDTIDTAADLVATNQDTIDTAADAATSTTQAGIATTQAGIATTQAGIATTQASIASGSASSATTAQAASEAARDASLAALDSFDDRYLGTKASDPTLDNDGDALVSGSLYFNTTSDNMKVYEGTTWLNAYSSLSGALLTTNNLSDLTDTGAARTNLGVDPAGTVNYTHPANHAISVITGLQTALDAKVDDTQVLTNVPSGAVFTDTNTTYSVGDGGLSEINFTSADHTKLNAIEAGADVTDTANVTSAGALMDSELADIAAVKATTGTFLAADETKLDGIETSANNYTHPTTAGNKHIPTGGTVGQILKNTAPGIATWQADNNTTYSVGDGGLSEINFTSADHTKLNGIEAGATADQTNAEIKTAYEANANTNEFSDAEQTKLAGIATSANNYTHPANHAISVITGLQTALDAKVDDSQVLTDVPSGALFTDTTYTVGDGGLTEVNFTTADNTKLDGIEALADVTDTANVTAAGAAMLTGATFTGDVTATDFIGPLNGAIQFTAKNTSGGTLTVGQVVYISGISGNTPTVGLADADDAAKMPAYGLVTIEAVNNDPVEITTFGPLTGVKTDYTGWQVGDTLYVSTTPGTLTNVAPTGEGTLLQNLGRIRRVHQSAGSITVGGAGRTNATPNLNDGNVFIGNASNQSAARALVIGDTTGLQTALDGKVDDSQVLTNVPSGAVFTDNDTIYTHPATHPISVVSGLQTALDGKETLGDAVAMAIALG